MMYCNSYATVLVAKCKENCIVEVHGHKHLSRLVIEHNTKDNGISVE